MKNNFALNGYECTSAHYNIKSSDIKSSSKSSVIKSNIDLIFIKSNIKSSVNKFNIKSSVIKSNINSTGLNALHFAMISNVEILFCEQLFYNKYTPMHNSIIYP